MKVYILLLKKSLKNNDSIWKKGKEKDYNKSSHLERNQMSQQLAKAFSEKYKLGGARKVDIKNFPIYFNPECTYYKLFFHWSLYCQHNNMY